MTQQDVARGLRKSNLLQYSSTQLQDFLRTLDKGTRGTREELIERTYNAIWSPKYDDPNFD